jgi:hypothetical protein
MINTLTTKPLLFTLALLLLLAVFIDHQTSPIESKDSSISAAMFSAERAFSMLQALTKEQVPHPVDSHANKVVEKRLVSMLRKMGFQEEIQDTNICADSSRGVTRCTRVRNIIVHIPGTSKNKGILLSAHYDSVPAGPGGSDAGAAVATLLETARLLSKQATPLNSITLLFNEGEEFGLFGAKAFMQHHPLAKQLQLAINVEARGTTGQSVMFETGENSGWLVKHYAKTTPKPLSSSLFYEVYKVLPNDTDLTVFKDHGLQGLNFAHAERLPHYHTPLDNLANLDKGSLQHHGDNVWGTLGSIMNIDLNNQEAGNLVYTDVLGLFVVQWDEANSLWISLCLLLLLIFLLYRTKSYTKDNLRIIIKSILGVLLILLVSALTAFIIQKIVLFFASANAPWRADSLPMQIAIWIGVSLSGLLIAKWIARNAPPMLMGIGVVLTWVLLSIVTSVTLPGISFLFILPSFVGLLVLLINTLILDSSAKSSSHNATTYVLVAIVMASAVIFMPIANVLEIMVSYQMATAIGLILGFIISSCLPLMALSSESRETFNKLVISHIFVLVCALTWTSLQSPFTAWMPQPLNMVYLQKADGQANIISGTQHNIIPSALSKTLKETKLTASFPWSKTLFHTSKIKSQNIDSPKISIISESFKENSRSIKIKVSANDKNFSGIKLYIPETSGLNTLLSNGDKSNFANEKSIRNGYFEYHCRGQSCSEVELEFKLTTLTKSTIIIAKILQNLPEEINYLSEKRGDKATQRHSGDQSMILTEFSL